MGVVQQRREDIRRLDNLVARPCCTMQRQPCQEPCVRREADVGPFDRWKRGQSLLDAKDDGARIQTHRAHHFGEQVPFHLRQRDKEVICGQARVPATACFQGCAFDDALGRFTDLPRRKVQIFDEHDISPSLSRVLVPGRRSDPEGMARRDLGASAAAVDLPERLRHRQIQLRGIPGASELLGVLPPPQDLQTEAFEAQRAGRFEQ
jgi:hypothetical protein